MLLTVYHPSEVCTRTDKVSVSGPICKEPMGWSLSTRRSDLTKVMRPLSSPLRGFDEVAGVKNGSKPCILKALASSPVRCVSCTQIMLGECPCRDPNSQVRLFLSPKVLGFHDTTLREDTRLFCAVGVLGDGATSDVILV